jgi:hypothetical protein
VCDDDTMRVGVAVVAFDSEWAVSACDDTTTLSQWRAELCGCHMSSMSSVIGDGDGVAVADPALFRWAVMVSTNPKVRYLSRSLCRALRPSSRVPQSRTGGAGAAVVVVTSTA